MISSGSFAVIVIVMYVHNRARLIEPIPREKFTCKFNSLYMV